MSGLYTFLFLRSVNSLPDQIAEHSPIIKEPNLKIICESIYQLITKNVNYKWKTLIKESLVNDVAELDNDSELICKYKGFTCIS